MAVTKSTVTAARAPVGPRRGCSATRAARPPPGPTRVGVGATGTGSRSASAQAQRARAHWRASPADGKRVSGSAPHPDGPGLPADSASVGSGVCVNKDTVIIIMPLRQYPHCAACSSIKACCTGCNCPRDPSPSRVVTARPCTPCAGTTHERAATPSISTVQAPH